MTPITILLVVIVALLAGMEGILDQWEFHQPLVACSLIGLVTGHPAEGIYPWWFSSDDCSWLGKHWRCNCSRRCSGICCIRNYHGFGT